MEEQQAKVPKTKEAFVQNWISTVMSGLSQSPLVSNVFFGFVLLCLEEFTEREFACPCDTVWNSLFAAVYLVVPAVLVLLLMISIKCFQNKTDLKECGECCASIFGPAILWIIIVLWDGHGFACAMTTWSGRYVEIDDAAPQKWCKPANLTSSQEFDFMNKTQLLYFISQAIGLVLIVILTAIFIVYLICKYICKTYGKCYGMCCGKFRRNEVKGDSEAGVGDTPLQDINK